MGLFDKLVKNAVGGAINDAVNGAMKGDLGKGLEKVTGLDLNGDGVTGEPDPFGAPPQSASAQQAGSAPQSAQLSYDSAGDAEDESYKDKDYFAQLLAKEFPQYQIAGSDAIAPGLAKPLDFVLLQDGKPAAAIALTEKGRYRNEAFRTTKATCQAQGVPFINFFSHMPNRPSYITTRIKTNLGLS
jgi:hypothetical protein